MGTHSKTMAYDAAGDLTKKIDICNTANCMVYGASGNAGPHALSSIVGTYNGVTIHNQRLSIVDRLQLLVSNHSELWMVAPHIEAGDGDLGIVCILAREKIVAMSAHLSAQTIASIY
jgi:hypothetical protein